MNKKSITKLSSIRRLSINQKLKIINIEARGFENSFCYVKFGTFMYLIYL